MGPLESEDMGPCLTPASPSPDVQLGVSYLPLCVSASSPAEEIKITASVFPGCGEDKTRRKS